METKREEVVVRGEEWVVVDPASIGGRSSTPLSAQRVQDWALVLEARGVPSRTEHDGAGWQLLVPEEFLKAAIEELCLFEKENRNWPPPVPPARPLVENTLVNLSLLILLATFHNITRLDISLAGHNPVDWVALGSARSADILHGQWWRLITALTLHADWLHLISNLALGGVFIVWLCRDLGSGLGWNLLLASGILGNLANAWLQPAYHSSVGASTIVFGAVGILAGINLLRYHHHRQRRWPLPFAAALALLALLGTEGKNTDLGAHLFGFLFGLGLGLMAELALGRYGRPGRFINVLLAMACAFLVVTAWSAALLS